VLLRRRGATVGRPARQDVLGGWYRSTSRRVGAADQVAPADPRPLATGRPEGPPRQPPT